MEVITVYPGRFHPFHKGHASSFNQLANEFGPNNTYLALSQKQEMPKSPFSAADRAKMAIALGIPKENIISVKQPYQAQEYIERFRQAGIDPEQTILVFGVSKKDMQDDPRFSFAPKKDGSPSYLQPYVKGPQEPMTKHAYVVSTDVADFPILGQEMRDASAIRSAYIKSDDNDKMRILVDLYGAKAAKFLKPVFDDNLKLTESIFRKIQLLKQKISESKNTINEGIVLGPDDLVDIYIRGRTPKGNNLNTIVGKRIPNKHVSQYIDFLSTKYKINPNAIVYGPTKFNDIGEATDCNTDYLEEK